ncbi:MAG TPA: hypothetical protein VK116_12595, partial [Planctomycetota bacterium]|nr:hypothetical protein [Planctomycetota bacterium]
FEHINPGSTAANDEPFVIDEIEGFQKPLSFQNNLDDPTTPFNERGDCRSDYFRTFDAVTRGYLIPIAAVEDLEDGSLESLFGWEPEGFDLAAYLRDVIYPKLWDPDDPSEPNPDVTMYHTVSGTQPTNFPLTHLMLMQIEVPIVVNQGGSCGAGAAAAQAMADYWGIPPTGATYRVSHILGANHDLVDAILGIGTIHPWLDEAEDGEERNLWHLDHFFRDGDTHLGKYEFSPPGATFSLRLDPTFGVIDNTFNRIFESVGGMAVAQLPRALGVDELPVELVVDLGSDAEDVAFQIGLLSEGEPVAWAQVSNQASLVALGGEGVDDGWFSGAGASQEGDAGGFGGVEIGDFARYVLRITPERVSLLEALRDEFAINDFSGLDPEVMDEIAFLDLTNAEVIAGIDAIAVAVDGSGAFSTIALLAAPPGSFTPGTGGLQRAADCNQDGNLDISDGVCLLGHLFLGNPSTLPCEGGTTNDPGNLALLDSDGNGGIQLTDAIAIFSFLFQGGAVPTICVDPLCAECIPIEGCPSVCN